MTHQPIIQCYIFFFSLLLFQTKHKFDTQKNKGIENKMSVLCLPKASTCRKSIILTLIHQPFFVPYLFQESIITMIENIGVDHVARLNYHNVEV